MASFADALGSATTAALDRLQQLLPDLLGALGFLVVGWLLAKLLRALTSRAAALLDALIARSAPRVRWRSGHSGAVLGNVVYWVVLLFFVIAAAQMLGLAGFADWLARLLDHLPTILAGLLIVAVGYVLSGFVADLVRATATTLPEVQRATLARLAQGATLVLALLVGADQIGLKVTWVAILGLLVAGAMIGAVTIAVSLGARGYVANLIGAHYLRQTLQPGQVVRVAGHEGQIVDVGATALVLQTSEGRVMLPGRVFHEEAIVLIRQAGAS
jgi:hypothetical protein